MVTGAVVRRRRPFVEAAGGQFERSSRDRAIGGDLVRQSLKL